MSRRFPIIALLTASLFLCLMPGCWPFDPPTGPGTKPPIPVLPSRTSPGNVLFNLKAIYADMDNIVNTNEDAHTWAEAYRTLFHAAPDSFTFFFNPGDEPPGWPNTWWGLNDEVFSFEMLLKQRPAGVVDDITLSWNVGASEPDPRFNPDTQELLHPTWRHIYVTGILLDVRAGENTYHVPNGTADFYFAPDPANPELWVITEWHDHQPPGGG